jgi:hypothetical protein
MVCDVARARGVQRISIVGKGGSGQFTVLVMGRTAYVRADAFALRNYLPFGGGLSAKRISRYANHWISIPHRDSYYADTAADVTLRSFIDDHAPLNDLTLGSGTVGGRKAESLHGWAYQVLTRTVYFRSVEHPLPVEFTDAWEARGSRERIAVGPWNRPVNVHAPAHPIPIATLETGPWT